MAAGEIRFGFLNGVLAVVEDAGGQDGIGLAPGDGVVEVLAIVEKSRASEWLKEIGEKE